MTAAMALADIDKSSIRQLCNRILADYFKDRKDLLMDYVNAKNKILAGTEAIYTADIPVEMRDFFATVEPHYNDDTAFFMSNKDLREEMPAVKITRITRFMRSIGHIQVVSKVGGKVMRGYWMRKIKEVQPSQSENILSFI
jgi:hypothetical protein